MLFSKLLIEEAGVAVAPGVGFGEYGEGFVRIGLVENEHRIRQAARNVKKFLANADEILGRAPQRRWPRNEPIENLAGRRRGPGHRRRGAADLPGRAARTSRRPAAGSIVTGVSARSRSRPRPSTSPTCPGSTIRWRWRRSPDTDIFVELIGGSDGPAKAAVEAALNAGKPVVTANKALIAEHGAELAVLAEAKGVPLLFEAAVMGGMPAVKMRARGPGRRRDPLDRRHPQRHLQLHPHRDGGDGPRRSPTCSPRPSAWAMPRPTRPWTSAASTPPTRSRSWPRWPSAARPTTPPPRSRASTASSCWTSSMARDLGYRIKLVASADRSPDGVLVRVHPSLAPLDHPLAQAGGALNALFIEGERIGPHLRPGPRRGRRPHRRRRRRRHRRRHDRRRPPGLPGARPATLSPFTPVDPSKSIGRAYLRLLVKDEPGVIAAVSETLAEAGVSIESFLQKPVENASGVPIVLTTHAVAESVLNGGDRADRGPAGRAGPAAAVAHRAHLRIQRWRQ